MEKGDRNIYGLIADILEYPTARITEQTKACLGALENRSRQAGKHLTAFADFCKKTPLGRIEELYTDTFDLDAVCCPYVGFHLFGEDRARGTFMVKLKEHYAERGHPLNGELPDHICVMLRFLGGAAPGVETRELIDYCLIPAAKKMISLFNDGDNPYRGVVEAALLVLEQDRGGTYYPAKGE